MTFYEQELEKIFGDSEFLSADTVITGKTLITKIGEDVRAKVDFVTINVHKQYEALRLSIINRTQGVIDTHQFDFVDILGRKNGYGPHIWESDGQAKWFRFEPTYSDYRKLQDTVEEYIAMYADESMNFTGPSMDCM